MPLSYFDPSAPQAGSSSEGRDLLHTNAYTIRPRIAGGGKRAVKRTLKRSRGGFVPSVMEGFVSATSKYLAPIALMMMYKYMNKSQPTRGKRGKRVKHRQTRRRRV